MIRRSPVSSRTDTLFPYTAIFRSRFVDGQFLVVGKLGGPLGLEGFALLRPALDQLRARPHLADQRFVARDDAAHLLLDRRQVVLGEGAVIEIGRASCRERVGQYV